MMKDLSKAQVYWLQNRCIIDQGEVIKLSTLKRRLTIEIKQGKERLKDLQHCSDRGSFRYNGEMIYPQINEMRRYVDSCESIRKRLNASD